MPSSFPKRFINAYGLIHKVLGIQRRQPRHGGYDEDGLSRQDIWLNDGNMLVLCGGVFKDKPTEDSGGKTMNYGNDERQPVTTVNTNNSKWKLDVGRWFH